MHLIAIFILLFPEIIQMQMPFILDAPTIHKANSSTFMCEGALLLFTFSYRSFKKSSFVRLLLTALTSHIRVWLRHRILIVYTVKYHDESFAWKFIQFEYRRANKLEKNRWRHCGQWLWKYFRRTQKSLIISSSHHLCIN